jgi:hypothetical protein
MFSRLRSVLIVLEKEGFYPRAKAPGIEALFF